jgi:hypothetical protein
VHRRAHPAVVICLAMVLAVALVSGMTALVAALVVPTWLVAALVVVGIVPLPGAPAHLLDGPFVAAASLRGPPPALLS